MAVLLHIVDIKEQSLGDDGILLKSGIIGLKAGQSFFIQIKTNDPEQIEKIGVIARRNNHVNMADEADGEITFELEFEVCRISQTLLLDAQEVDTTCHLKPTNWAVEYAYRKLKKL
jgi:hypothetical protein